MATKKKQTSPKMNAPYLGHIQYYVDDAIRTAVKACTLSQETLLVELAQLSDKGYRFSIEYDHGNNAYMSALFQRDSTQENAGWILACRHAEIDTCLALLYIMHKEVYQESWPTTGSETSRFDW
jgi:hypothetical protein